MGMLDGKKALIFGIANDHSIAYGIARQLKAEGAELGISYAGPAFERRVRPIADELGCDFVEECDLGSDDAIAALATKTKERFGSIDIVIHSVAFASREALSGRFMDVSRQDFMTAMNISVYTLVAIAQKFENILSPDASFLTMSYLGAEKAVPNYNVMGAAKAALEATVRYMALDLGKSGKRFNAISAGPIKTVSAAGIAGFKSMLPVYAERAPMGRNIDIDDCGRLAAFLVSDRAKNITGEIVHVDAGYNIVGY